MANKPPKPPVEFKTRMPPPPVARPPSPPAKRSGHVALFLMGTIAVGGAAYTLMPHNKCEQPPNVAQPSLLQNNTDCPPRSSGSGGSSSRSSYYSGGSSSGSSGSGTSESGSSHVTRGGFGSFAHAFGFSGG